MPTTFQPADGEGQIAPSLRRSIDLVLSEIPPEKSGAFVTAVTVRHGRTDITVAVAHRTANGWTAATWLRTNVRDDLEAGVYLKKVW